MFFVNKRSWTNWAKNESATPDYFHVPRTVEELQSIVDSCRIRGASLRVTGAAHSFSNVAKPDADTLALNHLRGLISYDLKMMEARIWAGTYLYEATSLLEEIGMAFENLGDIQEQTIAGAISTGTHGTGVAFGSLSDQVVAWTWIDGEGNLQSHRRGSDPLSKAMSLSLGLLGVLVDVTIKTVALYSLRVESTKETFQAALANWTDDIENNRHMEWFYFPGTDLVQVKKTNLISYVRQSPQSKAMNFVKDGLIETAAFKLISEICRTAPHLSRKMTALSAKAVPTGKKEGLYHEILPSPRLVKFTETEYALPLASFEALMIEMHDFLRAHPFYVHFPIECRVTAGEDAFLSPTQGKETVFLAFHMYKGMDNGPYFKWIHKLMARYGGRPHFGKIHQLTSARLKALYPKVDQFLEIREQLDPHHLFTSQSTKKLFS